MLTRSQAKASENSCDESTSYDPLEELAGGKSHPLIEASRNGDIESLAALLLEYKAKDRPIRVCDYSGWQAVHYAAKLSDTSCLSALLTYDEDLAHSVTRDLVTPLIVASGLGNIAAVRLLLKYLTKDDLADRDIHGCNALYYAIKCNNEQSTEIGLLLLKNRTKIEEFECLAESMPFTVIRYKNQKMFQYLLDAGLDAEYTYPHYYHYSDSACPKTPDTLMAHCVYFNWAEGLELLIRAVKGKLVNSTSKLVRSRLCHLCTLCYDHDKLSGAAWELVFYLGNIECLDLMLAEGMNLKTTMRIGQDEKVPCFPMSQTLSKDIWAKKEFIRHFLSMQSCSEFDEYYKEVLEKISDLNAGRHNDEIIDHPVDYAANAIYEGSERGGHTIEESIQMLLDCGFSFNFHYTVRPWKVWSKTPEFWIHSFARLLCLSHIQFPHQGYFPVATTLLECSAELTITADALAYSCIVSSQRFFRRNPNFRVYTSVPKIPYLCVLKKLSQRPEIEINSVYKQIFVTRHGLGKVKRELSVICDWNIVAHLAMKGFKVFLDEPNIDNLYSDYVISFSVLMLKDNERKKYFQLLNKSQLSKDVFFQILNDRPVSSLMTLCRTVIRDQLKVKDLLKEPVQYFYDESIAGASWEVSTIDQLDIPNELKDFLRYGPEFREYVAYCKRVH